MTYSSYIAGYLFHKFICLFVNNINSLLSCSVIPVWILIFMETSLLVGKADTNLVKTCALHINERLKTLGEIDTSEQRFVVVFLLIAF